MKILKPILIGGMALSISFTAVLAQNKQQDKGQFIEYKNSYWQEIEKSIKEFESKKEEPKKTFKIDTKGLKLPTKLEQFKQEWHNTPISQGSTGTCWCFSGTSMLESEIYRMSKQKIKISEMYTVYWQYVEKARRFVRERGNSHLGEGAQANAVTEMWKLYGCVPADAYTGLKPGQTHHAHDKMFNEIKNYLEFCKKNSIWNEDQILENVKSILNGYLGVPPTKVVYNGNQYTPMEFMKQVTKINPDDYVDFMSIMEKEYWKKQVHEVPDNWWKCNTYNNIPLDDFINGIKKAIKNGYTMVIGGDVSEAGMYPYDDIAIVPSFDIPSEYIDENARQFRYSNHTTEDDHGIHLLGYTEVDGKTWFLIKDSGSSARNGKHAGYFFYHEDYVKLKMLAFTVHKSAVEDILKKMKD